MNLSTPSSAVLSDATGAVLSTLIGTSRALSGREVARLSQVPQSTARRALLRLVEHGVATEDDVGAGAVKLYSLNRDHLAFPALELLANIRALLLERLRDELCGWTVRPLHASVFGSAARGDGDTASDIDIFIVRPPDVAEESPAWQRQTDRLAQLIRAWTGNRAGIAEVSFLDVQRLREEGAEFLNEIKRDALVLCGPPLEELKAEQA